MNIEIADSNLITELSWIRLELQIPVDLNRILI